MDPDKPPDLVKDNRDLSRQSQRSTEKDSRASHLGTQKKNFQDKIQNENKNKRGADRAWRSDPDRDRLSDGEGRSDDSVYSEDYENATPSERSPSPFPQPRSPSPSPQTGLQAKQVSTKSFHRTGGAWCRGVSRPQRRGGLALTQQHRRGPQSQSKESLPPKDLDLVTKRMLSARLLKINELRNALAELQQRADEVQKENRILKQLQARQEKVLQHYNDTESEISQLLSRHSNEVHVLHERLRRTQERQREAERRLKDSEEQLQRKQGTIARLKKLVDQRDLGARDELSRKLEEEKRRAQEAAQKIKDLERSIELSSNSYQRQLVAEKKKTVGAQEELKHLQEEMERLNNKLKEKERELDVRNIYAKRMMKPSTRQEAEVPSRSSTKAVQTDRTSSLDFPTPPPAISDAHECGEQAPDEYLSLKELEQVNKQPEAENVPRNPEEQKKKGKNAEKESNQQLNQKSSGVTDELQKEEEEDKKKTSSPFTPREDDMHRKRGHVQEEVARWNQESVANHQAAEEARQKKEQLLAKMHEIDYLNQGAQGPVFPESTRTTGEPDGEMHAGIREGRRSGVESVRAGRRALRSQSSRDELAFGSYAPSFGTSASRAPSGFPPLGEDGDSPLDGVGLYHLRGTETEQRMEKDHKTSLLQQLFGTHATRAGDTLSSPNKMEVLPNLLTSDGVRSKRGALLGFSSGAAAPVGSSINALHVAESKPAVRAIASYDDELEELAL